MVLFGEEAGIGTLNIITYFHLGIQSIQQGERVELNHQ